MIKNIKNKLHKYNVLFFVIVVSIFVFFFNINNTEAATITMPPNNLGLLAYYSFNDATSTMATDHSGNRRHGTLTNSPTWVQSKNGTGLSFTGASSKKVVLTDATFLDSLTTMTYSAWIYTNAVSSNSWAGIVSRYSSDNECANIQLHSNGSIYVDVDNSTTSYGVSASGTITNGSWYHVAMVYNGAGGTNADKLKLYVNGVEKALTFSGTISTTAPSGSIPLTIGSMNSATYFTGTIDDVRIYNRALSATEILGLAGNPRRVILNASRNSIESDGLVGHWTFDTIKSNTTLVHDVSGNNNHGTATNGAKRTYGIIGGGAIQLDGVNDYISVPHSSSLSFNSSQPFSIFAWSSRWTQNNEDTIVAKYSDTGGANTYGYRLYVNSSDKLVFEFAGGDSNNRIVKVSDDIVSGTDLEGFGHYGVTYDGSAQASGVNLYVNGGVVASTATADSLSGNTETNTPDLNIGISNGSAYPNNGRMDDVRIYNRVVNPPNVANMFRWGMPMQYATSNYTPPAVPTEGGYFGFENNYTDAFGFNDLGNPSYFESASYGFSGDAASGTYSFSVYSFGGFAHSRNIGWRNITHDDYEFSSNGDFSIGVKIKCTTTDTGSCIISYEDDTTGNVIWTVGFAGSRYFMFTFNNIEYTFSDLTSSIDTWEDWKIERKSGVLRAAKNGVTSSTTYNFTSASNSASGDGRLLLKAPYQAYFYIDELKIVKGFSIYNL